MERAPKRTAILIAGLLSSAVGVAGAQQYYGGRGADPAPSSSAKAGNNTQCAPGGWMMGPGMMGYGYGPGMMGPGMMGYGYGRGMMGGGMMGYGYGPGMRGYGYGPGMRGYGYGPGMRGYGYGPGPRGNGYGPAPRAALNLSVHDVTNDLKRWIAISGNPHLKVGSVVAKNSNTIVAEIVTKDKDALVERFSVNRHTGFYRPIP